MPRFFALATNSKNSRAAPHVHMLVKHAAAAEKSAIVYPDIAAEQAVVRDDHSISNFAVVTDVRSGHEVVFVADLCRTAIGAAAVNGAMLADDIIVADFHSRPFRQRKREVLWLRANDCCVPDHVPFADRNLALNHG